MSHAVYAKLWLSTQKDLEKVMELDRSILEGKPIEDRKVAADLVLDLYYQLSNKKSIHARYRRIVQNLTACHDQIVQPQIREIIGKMLDYSIVRMLEWRQEMINLTFTEYPWSQELLLSRRQTPDEMDLRAPAYDAGTRKAEAERRKKLVEEALANAAKSPEEEQDNRSDSVLTSLSSLTMDNQTQSSKSTMFSKRKRMQSEGAIIIQKIEETPEERAAREKREAEMKRVNDAIVLIQSHERARISRRIAINVEQRIIRDKKRASGEIILKKIDKSLENKSAIIIQKTWRGFTSRRESKKKLAELEEVIGMTMPYWRSNQLQKRSEALMEENLDIQPQAVQHLENTIKKEKEQIWECRGPPLIEEIRDEIREWMLLWFEELGKFDYIPPAKIGGSVLVATGEVRTPAEFLAESTTFKKPPPPVKPEDDIEEEPEDEENQSWQPQESKAMPFLLDTSKEFEERWSFRDDEVVHCNGRLILDLIREDLYKQLQLEMRGKADESMRSELQKLNQALLLDHANDDFALPTPQVFEGYGEEKTEKQKLKLKLEPEISMDELLLQLTRWKVLEDYPQCNLYDWPGVQSLIIRKPLQVQVGDMLQSVIDYCVLPVASKVASQLAPFVRSVCICGPPNSGQLFIAHAICSELKATVFNLTPEKHVGRFMVKKTQDSLVKAVLRVAKAYAPSVVLVEGEKAWLKKLPPEMWKVKPKRFASIYKRIVRGIKPGDQVLFLTTSTEPYMAGRPFVKLHDKFIIIPVADYATMYLAYKKQLMSHQAIDRHIDVSGLARVNTALETSIGHAQDVLAKSIDIRRRMTFKRRPLDQMEVFDAMLNSEKPNVESFNKFWGRLSLESKRREIEQEEIEAEMKEKEANKKK